MPRIPTPVESFGPEILEALLAGAKSRFEIQLPYRSAIRFRQRVYQLRTAMRAAKHELASQVAKTRIQITWPADVPTKVSRTKVRWPADVNTLCTLTISPNDSEFADALSQAGIKAKDVGDDILNQIVTENPALKGYE